jgi:predicted amidohydrolase
MIDNALAVKHFNRHMGKAPNRMMNILGPWHELSDEEKEEDILTADWVPNRAAWRRLGFKGRNDAIRQNLQ